MPLIYSKHDPRRHDTRLYKGGGSSTTVQSIPDELKPLATGYTNKAMNLGNQGFNPYYGQRYEDLNTTQNLGIGMIQDRALNGSQTLNNAEGALNQTIAGTSNPYLDAAVSKAQASALGAGQSAAIRSGSFGNSGIAEATAKQVADIGKNMYGQAYESDAGRRMQAIGMAPQFGNMAYQDAQQLMNAGNIMQDQNQQGLDFQYQQFQEAQNLPFKQLAAMSGVFGSNLGSTSASTQSGGGK